VADNVPELEHDPGVLKQKLKPLWDHRRQHGTLDAEQLEGLAEGCFRHAVHPKTPFADAVNALKKSIRLDGTNPKYAYHLSRLFHLHGMMDQARHWIAQAHRLCPTSHRIWAHVYLLHGELHAQYSQHANRERFDLEAIAQRRDKTAEAVDSAKNNIGGELLDFTVPKSKALREKEERIGRSRTGASNPDDENPLQGATVRPRRVQRMLNANECRWSGIRDLMIERLLQSPANQRNVPRLATLLEKVAQDVARRRGGVSAFVILAIQWIVSGYPTATVQRLRQTIPETGVASPAWDLLDTVCALYEANIEEVPKLLSDALVAERLPDLVVAVIHRRRVLASAEEFDAVGTYRTARKFYSDSRRRRPVDETAAQERIARATELAKQLIQASDRLDAPPPPLEDVKSARPVAAKISPERLAARFDRLYESADRLRALRDETLVFVREQIVPALKSSLDQRKFAQAVADHQLAGEVLADLENSAQAGLTQLNAIVEQLKHFDSQSAPRTFDTRYGQCDQHLKEAMQLGNLRRFLKRGARHLSEYSEYSAVGSPSTELTDVQQRIRDAIPTADEEEESPRGPSPAEALAELQQTASRLTNARDQGWKFLKNDLTLRLNNANEPGAVALAVADRDAVYEIVRELKQGGEEGSRRIEALCQTLAGLESSQLPPEFDTHRESCAKEFTATASLGNFNRALRRVDKKLDVLQRQHPHDSTAPSAVMTDLLAELRQIFTDDEKSETNELAENGGSQNWDEQVDRLATELEAGLTQLKALTPADRKEIEGLQAVCESALRNRELVLRRIATLREAGPAHSDGVTDLNAIEGKYQSLAQWLKPFSKALKDLGADNRADPALTPQSGLPALRWALQRTRWRINARFCQAIDSFDVYPASARRNVPLRDLIASVRARQAMTLFSIGRFDDARKMWTRMLSEDPLDAGALKNVAICETYAYEPYRALRAWRAYVEMLYFYDVVLGSPRGFCEQRSVFHRAIAGAYAIDYLNSATTDQELLHDEEAIFELLNNPVRLRSFLDHKILELIERQLGARSPLIRLGVTRDDDPSERETAVDVLTELIRKCEPILPLRVAKGYVAVLERSVAEAYEVCGDVNRLLRERDSNYDEEHGQHLKMLQEFGELKLRFYFMVERSKRLEKKLKSVDFLSEIRRLDDLPLTHSTGFGQPVASSLRLADPDMLARFSRSHIEPIIVRRVMVYLLAAEQDDPQANERLRLYHRLVEEWVHRPALKEHLPLIDAPPLEFYPESINQLIQQWRGDMSSLVDPDLKNDRKNEIERDIEEVLATLIGRLRFLCERYVALTGVAMYLVNFLSKLHGADEILPILERAAVKGLSEEGRRHCRQQVVTMRLNDAIENQQFLKALQLALEMLKIDDRTLSLVETVVGLFKSAAPQIDSSSGYDPIREAVDDWIERARKTIEEHEPSDDQPRPPVTYEEILEAEEKRDSGTVFWAHHCIENAVDLSGCLEAMAPVIMLLEADDRRLTLVEQVIAMFVRTAAQTGQDPDCDRLQTLIERWIERATESVAELVSGEEKPEPPPVTAADLDQAKQKCIEGVVSVRRQLMIASFNKGAELWQTQGEAVAEPLFETAREHAEYVRDHGEDDNQADDASKILEQLSQIRQQ